MSSQAERLSDSVKITDLAGRIDTLSPLRDHTVGPGTIRNRIAEAADRLRSEFEATGVPRSVDTCDLITLPYPTRFGLWRASRSPAPFLAITNRMVVVRWTETDGAERTLLFEPSDTAAGQATPYFADLSAKLPAAVSDRLVTQHGDVLGHLSALGIEPAEVDYLVFDHLHTQDVRRWLGTTGPQADVSPGEAMAPVFPNARLIVQQRELAELSQLHPMQQRWYQESTFNDLPPDSIAAINGDVMVGPGVAIIETPGHVTGNQTLVLNTSSGIWTSSENAIAAECLVPEHSSLPGVAKWAKTWGCEVVVNANTLEATADQYNSLLLERAIADPSLIDPRFPQFFPSSELTRRRSNPGTSPTFTHGQIVHEP